VKLEKRFSPHTEEIGDRDIDKLEKASSSCTLTCTSDDEHFHAR
jgi:hypothetical protein